MTAHNERFAAAVTSAAAASEMTGRTAYVHVEMAEVDGAIIGRVLLPVRGAFGAAVLSARRVVLNAEFYALENSGAVFYP